MRESEEPGCVIAIVHIGIVVLERGFGYADIVGYPVDAASPVSRGLALEDLHGHGHHEASRGGQARA